VVESPSNPAEPETPTGSDVPSKTKSFPCSDCGAILTAANTSKAQLAKKALGKCSNCVKQPPRSSPSTKGPKPVLNPRAQPASTKGPKKQ